MLPDFISDFMVELDPHDGEDPLMDVAHRLNGISEQEMEYLSDIGFRLVGVYGWEPFSPDRDDLAMVADKGCLTVFCYVETGREPNPVIYGPDGTGLTLDYDGLSVYEACRLAAYRADIMAGWFRD